MSFFGHDYFLAGGFLAAEVVGTKLLLPSSSPAVVAYTVSTKFISSIGPRHIHLDSG